MNREVWLKQAYDVLQKVEWAGSAPGVSCCPYCRAARLYVDERLNKHNPDCRLAELLKELPE